MGLLNVNCSIVLLVFPGSTELHDHHQKNEIAPPAKCYKKFMPIRVDWEKKKKKEKATILCSFSHQEVKFIPTALVAGHGHVTCFGQWFISKYDACRGLKSA